MAKVGGNTCKKPYTSRQGEEKSKTKRGMRKINKGHKKSKQQSIGWLDKGV